MNTSGDGADETAALPGRLGSGVPPGTTARRKLVIPAGIAGIPRTYRQKVWWHQGTPGSCRR